MLLLKTVWYIFHSGLAPQQIFLRSATAYKKANIIVWTKNTRPRSYLLEDCSLDVKDRSFMPENDI